MRRRGFTLIELLLVFGIIILLMAILVPSMSAARRTVRIRETHSRIDALAEAVREYHRVYGDYPPCVSPDRSILRTGDSYPMYHYPVEYRHSTLGMTTEA